MTGNVVRIDEKADAVWRARVDLAAAHRLAHRFGFDDGIWNHFTLMVPGAKDRFFVKPHGVLMSEVTASNLIVSDFDGNIGSRGAGRNATIAHRNRRGTTSAIDRPRNAPMLGAGPVQPAARPIRDGECTIAYAV